MAHLCIGYSGAELANLLNEAAILAVRRNAPTIDMRILKEAMDKVGVVLSPCLPGGGAGRLFTPLCVSGCHDPCPHACALGTP